MQPMSGYYSYHGYPWTPIPQTCTPCTSSNTGLNCFSPCPYEASLPHFLNGCSTVSTVSPIIPNIQAVPVHSYCCASAPSPCFPIPPSCEKLCSPCTSDLPVRPQGFETLATGCMESLKCTFDCVQTLYSCGMPVNGCTLQSLCSTDHGVCNQPHVIPSGSCCASPFGAHRAMGKAEEACESNVPMADHSDHKEGQDVVYTQDEQAQEEWEMEGDNCLELGEDGDLVMTDEWLQFFAESEARREERKRLRKEKRTVEPRNVEAFEDEGSFSTESKSVDTPNN